MADASQTTIIDLLVAKIQGLGLAINRVPVRVYDGIEGPDEEDNFVCVMGWPDEPDGAESTSTQEVAYIGFPLTRYENYDLAVVASCYVGGADEAQATARANLRTIESAIESAMLADPNLAVQNGGTAACIWCLLRTTRYSQAPPFSEEGEGAMGRFANCLMRFHVFSLLGPG